MKNNVLTDYRRLLLLASCILLLTACSKVDDEAPRIDSVWYNMVNRPIEQAVCAYPGQTICLHGEHLGNLTRIIVNGTDVALDNIYVYESDHYITFTVPSDVKTEGDFIRIVTRYGMTDYPFIIRPSSEQPTITKASSTTLVAGSTLIITGTNLDGAKEVWLPLTFDETVKCEFDTTQENSDTEVYVTIPDGVDFATGQIQIVMDKYDDVRDLTYTESVFSAEMDFK